MGDGSASGAGGRPPKFAHLMLPRESWPNVPDKILALKPEKLQQSIDGLRNSLRRENESIFMNIDNITKLENAIHVCDLAQTIQSRQRDYDQARDMGLSLERYYIEGMQGRVRHSKEGF